MMLNKSYLKGIVGSGVIAGLAVAGTVAFVVISQQPDAPLTLPAARDSPCGPLTSVTLATPEGSIQFSVPETEGRSKDQLRETISLTLPFPDPRLKAGAPQETRQVALTLYTDVVSQKGNEWYWMRDPLAFWSAVPLDEIDAVLAAALPGQEVYDASSKFGSERAWNLARRPHVDCGPNIDCFPGGPPEENSLYLDYILYYLIKPKSDWRIRNLLMLAHGSTRHELQTSPPHDYINHITDGPFTPAFYGTFDKMETPVHFVAQVENPNNVKDKTVATTEEERQQFLDSLDHFLSECVLIEI